MRKDFILKSVIGKATLEILVYKQSVCIDDIIVYISMNTDRFEINKDDLKYIRTFLSSDNIN